MSEQEEHDVVLGVVPPPTEGKEPSEYEQTLARVNAALDVVRTRLTALRAERASINEEVKRLVEELEMLERMSRVVPKPPKP